MEKEQEEKTRAVGRGVRKVSDGVCFIGLLVSALSSLTVYVYTADLVLSAQVGVGAALVYVAGIVALQLGSWCCVISLACLVVAVAFVVSMGGVLLGRGVDN